MKIDFPEYFLEECPHCFHWHTIYNNHSERNCIFHCEKCKKEINCISQFYKWILSLRDENRLLYMYYRKEFLIKDLE